ncbi:putative disease resistance protein RGA3 isoform X2 [Aristolochia californica]
MGFEKELTKLKRYLLGVQPLLKDAEIRQFTDESVRSWVTDLMGLAYDMEDIVDEMNTQILQLQILERNRKCKEQVPSSFSSHDQFDFFSLVRNLTFNDEITSKINELLKNNQIASKINEVLKRWEAIVAYGNLLQLRKDIGGRTLEEIKKRRETTSIPYENRVFGRDDDFKEISALLKSDHESNGENVFVIAIIAMGGSGKTTLAKLAYNDPGVEFHEKAWVYVSHEFDCKKVTGSIIESLQNHRCDLSNLDQMQRCLLRLVESKKYLIVLDDAWTENPDDWDCLMAPLRAGGKGSMIIVTTRSEKVSKSIGAAVAYKLKGLSDDDCWAIIKKKAFGNNDTNECQKVEDIKMDVVSKCKGLPLVANVLGGFLRTIEINNWRRLLKSELWDLPKTKDDILSALILSYLSLSPHLKRCFTYCASFPKGYNFSKEELVRQWMAQGFVEGNGSHELEDIGNDYFDDLVARHFLHKSEYMEMHFLQGSEYNYVMHDLNHDLAQMVMGNISFTRIKEEINQPTKETRYMFLDGVVFDEELLEQLSIAKGVRTLRASYRMIDVELNDLIRNFERLRVLHFYSIQIGELPESVCNLKHLRFLGLPFIGIKSLPDSICNLYNLQTLNFNGCENLVELPRDMGNLINLQHLLLSLCSQLKELPDSVCVLKSLQVIELQGCKLIKALPTDIGSLKNLRRLDLYGSGIQRLPESISWLINLEFLNLDSCNDLLEFPKDIIFSGDMKGVKFHRLDIGNERGIEQLKNFMNLSKRLYIENLENVKSVEEAKTACIKNKQQIVELKLTWEQVDTLNLRDENFEADVLEALEPAHAKLECLTITNYCGFKLPRWMGDPSFSNVVVIKIIDCVNCELLAPLGQLCSLKKLIIQGMRELKHVGREFFGIGTFPSLVKLVLKNLPNLEGQFEVKEGDFFCLTKLEVVSCPKLTTLPFLPSLRNLEVGYCNKMILVNSLPYLTSVVSLAICDLPLVELLSNGLLQPLTELRKLVLDNCYQLRSLPVGLPDTLSELKISSCPNLKFFGNGTFPALQKLVLKNLLNLEAQFEVKEGDFSCLIELEVVNCPKLTALPSLPSLRNLEVGYCNEIILVNSLPYLTSVFSLVIRDLPRVKRLPNGLLQPLTELGELVLHNCYELVSLPEGLPDTLSVLKISSCPNLNCLLKGLPNVSSLKMLLVEDCPRLEISPEELTLLRTDSNFILVQRN